VSAEGYKTADNRKVFNREKHATSSGFTKNPFAL